MLRLCSASCSLQHTESPSWALVTGKASDVQVPFYPDSSVQVQLDSTAAGEWQGDLLAIGLYEEDLNDEGMSCACHAGQSTLAFLQLIDG